MMSATTEAESENSQLETHRDTRRARSQKETAERTLRLIYKTYIMWKRLQKLRVDCSCFEQGFRLGLRNAKAHQEPQNSTTSAQNLLSKPNSKVAEGDENVFTWLKPELRFLMKAARNCTTWKSAEMMKLLVSAGRPEDIHLFYKAIFRKSAFALHHRFNFKKCFRHSFHPEFDWQVLRMSTDSLDSSYPSPLYSKWMFVQRPSPSAQLRCKHERMRDVKAHLSHPDSLDFTNSAGSRPSEGLTTVFGGTMRRFSRYASCKSKWCIASLFSWRQIKGS